MIAFVTPAWRRFELTRVVLEQRRYAMDFLAERGIPSRSIVIANDQNADIAKKLGCDVLNRPNYALARRFNDGFQFAATHGAEWIVPIGSDSFLDPAYLFPLPDETQLRTSHLYAIADAKRLGRLRIKNTSGVGPYMIHRSHLPGRLRPAAEWLKRGVDKSTIQGLKPGWEYEFVDLHPWQYVGFRSYPQMNPYDKLYRRMGKGQEAEVYDRLAQYYPAHLVERAIALCDQKAAA